MTVQPGLCRTWSETQIVDFVTHRLNFKRYFSGHKFTAGVKALRTLLSGAREVAPTDILRREYVKSGGIERAISDFYSVKPKNIRAADDQKIVSTNHHGNI